MSRKSERAKLKKLITRVDENTWQCKFHIKADSPLALAWKKKAVGLRPVRKWLSDRVEEIFTAMHGATESECVIPEHWISELSDLVKMLKTPVDESVAAMQDFEDKSKEKKSGK